MIFDKSFRSQVPRPGDVFTPTQLPIEDGNVYAHREEVERKINRFLKRGQVPLIFGEYAVGKTTVAWRVITDIGYRPNMVYISSTAGKSMSDILSVIVEKLALTQTESKATVTSSGMAGAEAVIKGEYSESSTQETSTRFLTTSPTDVGLIDILRERRVLLVIDEMHRASEELRQDLSDFIRASHGQNVSWPKVVLIGTSSDASELVRIDPGNSRFLKELRVSPLTVSESEDIVRTGFSRLNINLSNELVERLVKTAAGAPSLLQSLCLEIAESCFDSGRTEVTEDDYRVAVKSYLEENEQRLTQSYTQAIEHTGPKRYRKQILISMSILESEYPELEEIRQNIEDRLGVPVPQSTLSGPLRALKDGADPVLKDVRRSEGGRVHNVSTFRDPMMKSFIRFLTEVESQGLLPQR